jgi:hypothetical protein
VRYRGQTPSPPACPRPGLAAAGSVHLAAHVRARLYAVHRSTKLTALLPACPAESSAGGVGSEEAGGASGEVLKLDPALLAGSGASPEGMPRGQALQLLCIWCLDPHGAWTRMLDCCCCLGVRPGMLVGPGHTLAL